MFVEREEGSLLLDGAPTRRWVSIIAVVIPVGAFVLLSALFIRTYIVPPTYGIPGPTTTAEALPSPVVQPRRVSTEAVRLGTPDQAASAMSSSLPMLATLAVAPPSVATTAPARAESAPSGTPASSVAPVSAANMTASIAPQPAAIPTPMEAPAPPANPTVVASVAPAPVVETTGSRREISTPSIIAAEPAAAAESAVAPVVDHVPLPRAKPHHSVAVASRAIPLPRPRPVEEAPESDLPVVDRHAIN